METETGAGWFDRLKLYLSAPVSAQSLAVMRIVFGLIMTWEYMRFVGANRIVRYYAEPMFNFPYFGWDWIRPLPEPYIYWAWDLVGLCAFLVALGLLYRVAIVVFTVVFVYFFLLDQVQYLNHFYMVILYAVLLCFMPANRMWSLDALLFRSRRSDFIPRWPVSVLRWQTEVILIFAGLVKIAPDWLQGQPLFLWLRGKEDAVYFGALFHYDWAIVAGSWATVALHVLGAPLLLWKRTRLWIFLIYCIFHISNANLFNIGIFPWMTIAVTLIFFEPDWPTRVFRFVSRREPPEAVPSTVSVRAIGTAGVVALLAWFAVQIYLPLRQGLFRNNVAWTDDGHKFSWRMRIFDRDARGYFFVRDPKTGETWEAEPKDILSPRSAARVMTRAELVHGFAQKIEEMMRERGHEDVEVYAHIEKSLNGRAFQTFIDPEVDLTEVPFNYFGPDPWVVPLTTDLWDTRGDGAVALDGGGEESD
jgi:HTTM domain/Vitamin K-dependent gamma-carboxylase, lumenal domain